jgi:deaminated glutathione amidase
MILAALQMTSNSDKDENLEVATELIREAHQKGADFVALPEVFNWFGSESGRSDAAEFLDGPTLTRMASLARQLNIYVLAGSILERNKQSAKLFNTAVLFDDKGDQISVYRKMHLFDVDVGDGQKYLESEAVAPGPTPVSARFPGGKVGLSICYDLRFPELYRNYSRNDCTLLAVPAAFTATTGKDHWEVLLRARAIENQSYVIAPAQQGAHLNGKHTFGHALIADPWGKVIAEVTSEGPGIAIAKMDFDLVKKIRTNLPALMHRKL